MVLVLLPLSLSEQMALFRSGALPGREVPVRAHVRQTAHGLAPVAAHVREIEVALPAAPPAASAVPAVPATERQRVADEVARLLPLGGPLYPPQLAELAAAWLSAHGWPATATGNVAFAPGRGRGREEITVEVDPDGSFAVRGRMEPRPYGQIRSYLTDERDRRNGGSPAYPAPAVQAELARALEEAAKTAPPAPGGAAADVDLTHQILRQTRERNALIDALQQRAAELGIETRVWKADGPRAFVRLYAGNDYIELTPAGNVDFVGRTFKSSVSQELAEVAFRHREPEFFTRGRNPQPQPPPTPLTRDDAEDADDTLVFQPPPSLDVEEHLHMALPRFLLPLSLADQLGLFGSPPAGERDVPVRAHVRRTAHGVAPVAPHQRHVEGGRPADPELPFGRPAPAPAPAPAPPAAPTAPALTAPAASPAAPALTAPAASPAARAPELPLGMVAAPDRGKRLAGMVAAVQALVRRWGLWARPYWGRDDQPVQIAFEGMPDTSLTVHPDGQLDIVGSIWTPDRTAALRAEVARTFAGEPEPEPEEPDWLNNLGATDRAAFITLLRAVRSPTGLYADSALDQARKLIDGMAEHDRTPHDGPDPWTAHLARGGKRDLLRQLAEQIHPGVQGLDQNRATAAASASAPTPAQQELARRGAASAARSPMATFDQRRAAEYGASGSAPRTRNVGDKQRIYDAAKARGQHVIIGDEYSYIVGKNNAARLQLRRDGVYLQARTEGVKGIGWNAGGSLYVALKGIGDGTINELLDVLDQRDQAHADRRAASGRSFPAWDAKQFHGLELAEPGVMLGRVVARLGGAPVSLATRLLALSQQLSLFASQPQPQPQPAREVPVRAHLRRTEHGVAAVAAHQREVKATAGADWTAPWPAALGPVTAWSPEAPTTADFGGDHPVEVERWSSPDWGHVHEAKLRGAAVGRVERGPGLDGRPARWRLGVVGGRVYLEVARQPPAAPAPDDDPPRPAGVSADAVFVGGAWHEPRPGMAELLRTTADPEKREFSRLQWRERLERIAFDREHPQAPPAASAPTVEPPPPAAPVVDGEPPRPANVSADAVFVHGRWYEPRSDQAALLRTATSPEQRQLYQDQWRRRLTRFAVERERADQQQAARRRQREQRAAEDAALAARTPEQVEADRRPEHIREIP